MAAAEQQIMKQLGWQGQGLIEAVGSGPDEGSGAHGTS